MAADLMDAKKEIEASDFCGSKDSAPGFMCFFWGGS